MTESFRNFVIALIVLASLAFVTYNELSGLGSSEPEIPVPWWGVLLTGLAMIVLAVRYIPVKRKESETSEKAQEETLTEKKTSFADIAIVLFACAVVFVGIYWVAGGFSDPGSKTSVQVKQASKPSAPLTREQKIRRLFSGWDGSNLALKRSVKKFMHDPKSFEHVKTTYAKKGEFLQVKMVYRGKNRFGALVLGYVVVKMDLDGNILEIIDQG